MKSVFFVILIIIVILGGAYAYKMRSEKGAPTVNYGATQQADSTTTEPTTIPHTTNIGDLALDISEPTNNASVTTATITIKGKTAPSASVFINDLELKADAMGFFSTPFTLTEGTNPIIVAANDTDGNYAEKQLTIEYTAP